MKREDIDKKIGMPDVDAEWAKFEREVIGREDQPKKRALAPWAWGIGIVASIAIVAGLFLFGNGQKEQGEGALAIAEENHGEVPEEKRAKEGIAEKVVTGNTNDKQSDNLLAEAEPALKEETRQGQETDVSALVQDVTEDDFSTVEEQPHFPGGDKDLMDFIRKNLRYPALAQAYVTGGRVVMSMKIDTLGQLSDIKAMRFMLGYVPSLLSQTSEAEQTELKANISRQLEEECARVIALMPTWQPGRVMGKRTNMRYYIPFTLQPELLAKARESEKQDPLQGRIAGLDLDDNPVHYVTETVRPSLPYLWERDTVLTLVNGKENSDFLRYLSSTSHVSISNIYDYFFERNQLYLKQFIPSKEEQKTRYDVSLFEGRDIRLVVDYQTKPFTPVSQLTREQIISRRLAYLRNKYRAGFSKNSNQDYYAPDLYDSPARERIFGLTAAKCHSYRLRHEYFGPMGSDSHGIYVPLIRDVVMTTQDDAWLENGELCILKDDPHFNQVVIDIQQASTCAESSAVTSGDSIVRLAFIFGGEVAEGQPNDLLSGMQKQLFAKVKTSTFAFKPDADAPSWWWGEAYYSITSTQQRQLWMHLHSVDKLYAADCPELLSNRRHVEGIVTDEKGEPLAAALVSISTHATPWDAVKTDSKGHFDMWIPFHDATIRVNHVGYIPMHTQPADTILNFRMKDATKIKEVKVIPKKDQSKGQ